MFIKNKKAFSLIELLVVISIIALLLSVLMPVLSVARSQGRAVICRFNLHQLVLANTGYATENNGFYVPAASDMWLDVGLLRGGFHRWHGVRKKANEPFNPLKGPLVKYLADGKVKECPEKNNFVKDKKSFEQGCGGYGYNGVYIGSQQWRSGLAGQQAYECTTRLTDVASPAETIMFTDCAMARADEGAPYYLEYSFAEPPLNDWGYAWPSIHFRHRGRANVGWVDGHISSEVMNDFNIVIYDGINSSDVMLGWFGPLDNTLFDLK